MAQTKRKRRNKHRGNAVGMVEARGRTSKPQPGAKKGGPTPRNGARGARTRVSGPLDARGNPLKPPTFQSAMLKAFFGVVILFIFFRFLTKDTTTSQALGMCSLALLLYTPIMYLTDRFIYKRRLKQQGYFLPAKGAKPERIKG